jgi:hypothetical protein
MSTLFAYLGLPVIAFAVLATLPRGRPAFIGIVVAALAVALLGPVVLPEDGSGYASLLLWVFGGAIAAAGLAQGLRLLPLPLPYGLVVLLVLLVAAAFAAWRLGVF